MVQLKMAPENASLKPLSQERFENSLAFAILSIIVGLFADFFFGVGFSDYLSILKADGNEGDSMGRALFVMLMTSLFLFLLAFGQILGDLVTEILWEREKRLLESGGDKGVLRRNLFAELVSRMVGFRKLILPLTAISASIGRELIEKVLNLWMRGVYLTGGLVIGIYLAMYLRAYGAYSQLFSLATSLEIFSVSACLLALAVTSLPRVWLVGVVGISLLIEAFGEMIGEINIGSILIRILPGFFFLLIFVRAMKLHLNSPSIEASLPEKPVQKKKT